MKVFSPVSWFGLNSKDEREKHLYKSVKHLIGANPSNLELYRLAFLHASASRESVAKSYKESNERLEFLGDSVLGMITAAYLFKKFPFKDEGFLTEIRSRMVSRESLNVLGRKLGLEEVIEYENQRKTSLSRSSMYGDALEAFIGAVYLDKGFGFTQKFVTQKILAQYFDLDTVVQNNPNFKSILIEWAQKEGKKVQFTLDEEGAHHDKEFTAFVLLENEKIAEGKGYSKKKAEQNAAMKACEALKINQ
ncbi:ribonuclease III [Aquirufa sp.]|jgi:ribonuclease-3|uniref:ribonuclease III n=1 Tax=Aquirufa sp. TaxID=2676249 RepID=UPI0037C0EF42